MQCIPVKDISTFVSRWAIKVVIQKKDPIRTYNTQKGMGRILNLVLRDEHGDEIGAKVWNDGIKKFDDMITEGKTYIFSKGRVNLANKRYTVLPHPYEITFDENSTIQESEDLKVDSSKKYHLLPGGLRGVHTTNKEMPFNMDLIGILVSSGVVETVNLKNGDSSRKRDIYVADATGYKLQVVVWGEPNPEYTKLLQRSGIPVGLQNIKISEYKGKRGQINGYEYLEDLSNSDKPEVAELMTWWRDHGSTSTLESLIDERRSSIASESAVNLGTVTLATAYESIAAASSNDSSVMVDTRPIWFTSVVVPGRIYHTYERDGVSNYAASYLACDTCSRKVTDMGCMVCAGANKSQKFTIQMSLYDTSASRFGCRAFHGPASIMCPFSAQEAHANRDDPTKLNEMFNWDVCYRPFRATFKCENKEYQGQYRMNIQVFNAVPLDYEDEADALLNEIEISFPEITMKTENEPSTKREGCIPLPRSPGNDPILPLNKANDENLTPSLDESVLKRTKISTCGDYTSVVSSNSQV